MKHLIIIISIITVTLMTYLATKNSDTQSNIKSTKNYTTQVTSIFQGSKSTIREDLVASWLDDSILDKNSGTNINNKSTDIPDLISIKTYKKLIILDLPIDNTAKLNTSALERIVLKTPSYWEVVYSIESKQGKMLYRPRNKAKSCKSTNAPCGHYQISEQTLKDIGCITKQCKIDRENHDRSLEMSKTLERINLGRLAKSGYTHLPDFQKYLIHQQGATGIRLILDAKSGKYELSKKLTKNMANNSSYSYKQLKRFGSKQAAKKFLSFWKNRWDNEIDNMFDSQLREQLTSRTKQTYTLDSNT